MSIATVKAFLSQNFQSPIKNWPKNLFFFAGGEGNGIKIVLGPPKGTSLHKTTSLDVFIVKIRATEEPKN